MTKYLKIIRSPSLINPLFSSPPPPHRTTHIKRKGGGRSSHTEKTNQPTNQSLLLSLSFTSITTFLSQRSPNCIRFILDNLTDFTSLLGGPQVGAESAMVSLRRRRLLGYCSGIIPSKIELPKFVDNGNVSEKFNQHIRSSSVHPVPSASLGQPKEMNNSKLASGSSNLSGTSSSKEEHGQVISAAGQEVKRRKRYRRKSFADQEPCIMRGVYFKNMKWQAAIKVDKKQIHLGTVGSQEEAAHLYDRAAFMCGREPNFELSEEEKQELRQFDWEDFLSMTRDAITNKKHQKRLRAGSKKKIETPLQSD